MMMCENGMEKDAPHTDTLAMQVWGFFFKAELSTKQIAVEPHTVLVEIAHKPIPYSLALMCFSGVVCPGTG